MDTHEALKKPPAKKPPEPSTSDPETEAAVGPPVQMNPEALVLDEIFADVNAHLHDDSFWDFDFDQLDQQPNVSMFSI